MSVPLHVYCIGIVPPSMNDGLVRENFIGLPVDGADRAMSAVIPKTRHKPTPLFSTLSLSKLPLNLLYLFQEMYLFQRIDAIGL